MKKIVELIRMILGSAAIGFVITAILGGAFLLVSGWWNEPNLKVFYEVVMFMTSK